MTTPNHTSLTDEQIRNIENDQAKMPGVTRENLTARTVRAALIAQHGFCLDEDQCTCAREIGYRVCQPSNRTSPSGEDAANGATIDIGARMVSTIEVPKGFKVDTVSEGLGITRVIVWRDTTQDAADANGAMGEREAIIDKLCGQLESAVYFMQKGSKFDCKEALSLVKEARAALSAEKVAGQSVDEIRRAVWREAHSVCLEGVKWTPEPSKEVQFYIRGTCHRLAAEISSRAGLIDEKAAEQEPVALEHVAVAEDGGKLRWMTGRRPRDCELYAMTNGGRAPAKLYAAPPQPAQSAEQDERVAYSVEDWFRDLAGDRPISHVLQEMTHAELAVRAFSAGRAASTATQPVQAQVALTLTLDQLVAVRAAANLAESMGSVVISTDLRSILLAAQPASGGEA
jgi:hypothetical protein